MVHNEASSFDRSFYVLPNDTPVCKIDCSNAFAKLTSKEQQYAHHMAKAAWFGSLIVYHQVTNGPRNVNLQTNHNTIN